MHPVSEVEVKRQGYETGKKAKHYLVSGVRMDMEGKLKK